MIRAEDHRDIGSEILYERPNLAQGIVDFREDRPARIDVSK